MINVIGFIPKGDTVPDGGAVEISPFKGHFIDDGGEMFGFITMDTDHNFSISGLSSIPENPLDILHSGLQFGDQAFREMLSNAILKQRIIKIGTSVLEYNDYIHLFPDFKAAKVIPLAPTKVINNLLNAEEDKTNG